MLNQTTLGQGTFNYIFLLAPFPIVLIGDLKFMPTPRDRLKVFIRFSSQCTTGTKSPLSGLPSYPLTLGQMTGWLWFLRTLRTRTHTQLSEDVQGTTPASQSLHCGWLLRMPVFGRMYILLCSQSMQLNISKGGFPALIMAPQPSRTLAIRWDSLGQP